MGDQVLGRLLSRKFILSLLAWLSSTALVWFGRISDDVYSVTLIATVAAYITGNVVGRK